MSELVGSSYDATLNYSEPLLRRVVLVYWRRTVGIAYPLVLMLSAVGVVLLALGDAADWIVVALTTFLVLGSLIVPAIYIFHYRNTIGKFRRMGSLQASLHADATALTIASDLGSSTIAWHAIVELWRYPEFWLLMFSEAQFGTLPTASLSAELQQFIVQQVTAAGGKVS